MRPSHFSDAELDDAIRARAIGHQWSAIALNLRGHSATTLQNALRAARPEQYQALLDETRRKRAERKRGT